MKKDVNEKIAQKADNEKWSDEGTSKTEVRKAEAEAKRKVEASKRLEKKAIADADAALLAKSLAAKPTKVTNFEMQQNQQKSNMELKKQQDAAELAKKKIFTAVELSENSNQTAREQRAADVQQYGAGNVVDASGITDALQQLQASGGEDLSDRHPEKRLKAAFKAYEELWMPQLRAEHGSLRLSQIRELLWEQWQKSGERRTLMEQRE